MIVPDGFEPVVALRTWRLDHMGNLVSMNGKVWPVGQPMKADCTKRHLRDAEWTTVEKALARIAEEGESALQVPVESCTCGIYAAKEVWLAMQYHGNNCVIGQVYLWGKIIEGRDGWRAEYAYPKRLYFYASTLSVLDFFGLDRDFPSYVAWQEYRRQQEAGKNKIETPYMQNYGVELIPATMSELQALVAN